MTEKLNMHGDHVASCLCCANLDMGYEGDLSDQTPGRGWFCNCLRTVFFNLQPNETHKLQEIGATCALFEPMRERKVNT